MLTRQLNVRYAEPSMPVNAWMAVCVTVSAAPGQA